VPDNIDKFLGNPTAATCLRAVASSVDADAGPAFTNFLISVRRTALDLTAMFACRGELTPAVSVVQGGNCTGKSTFAGILQKTLRSSTAEPPCRFASFNASEFA